MFYVHITQIKSRDPKYNRNDQYVALQIGYGVGGVAAVSSVKMYKTSKQDYVKFNSLYSNYSY